MPHCVPTNINFSVESSSANLAGEWFDARVPPHVCEHVRRLTKHLTALLTLEWFHSSVHQCVLFHVGLAEKIFAAITARIRLVIGMNKFVC